MAMVVSQNSSPILDPFEMEIRNVTDTKHVALYMMLSFFCVLGVIGNAVAFYIFFRRRNSGGTSVIFILALAGTDFITCLVTVPYSIVFEALRYQMHYDELCKLYFFFATSTIPYSSFIMAGIAFDRYFCICHPFLRVFTVQRARMVVLFLAIPALLFGIIISMFYGIYDLRDHLIVNGSFLLGTNITRATVIRFDGSIPMISVSDLDSVSDGYVVETEVPFLNMSRMLVLRKLEHNGECFQNRFHFSTPFQKWFQFVYSSCYALCFVTVSVLYILIYKFIFNRRAMKARRKRNNHNYVSVETQHPLQNRQTEAETAMTELNGHGSVHTKTINHHHHFEQATATTSLIDGESTRPAKRRGSAARDRNLYANIKTAMMLFVVTLVFIVAFAPSWFMAHEIISIQLNVFYVHFVYNVANPFIYAFMNQAFRDDLKKLLKRS
ncbi:hypothetical protein ACOMHN_067574 [Nucella lapillus]